MKILIISHNPCNSIDNMGITLRNLFSKFNKEELCQLYFKEQEVDTNICKSYFCISDMYALKSIFNKKIHVKEKLGIDNPQNIEYKKNIFKTILNKIIRKKNGIIYFIRDLIWKYSNVVNSEISEWLNKEKPSCIFLAAGGYTFIFKIARKIADEYNIPIYTYIVDEYCFSNEKRYNLIKKLYNSIYRKQFIQIIKDSKQYFCISESMLSLYKERISKNGSLLMNVVEDKNFVYNNKKVNKKNKIIISYFGNVSFNRWKNLIDIADIISILNQSNKLKYEFNVYTAEKNEIILDKFKRIKELNYKGFVSGEKLEECKKNSDILLHVESFDSQMIEKVKYSLSTKIPQILCSGKLFIEYGPIQDEAINYIMKNNAGLVANNKIQLSKILQGYIDNIYDINLLISNEIELFKKNHRADYQYNKLYEILRGEK